jgi:hypothetical protein
MWCARACVTKWCVCMCVLIKRGRGVWIAPSLRSARVEEADGDIEGERAAKTEE